MYLENRQSRMIYLALDTEWAACEIMYAKRERSSIKPGQAP